MSLRAVRKYPRFDPSSRDILEGGSSFILSATDDRLEAQRVAALKRTGLLDSPPEPEFDELVQIAAAICAKPIGVVSLIDRDRQFIKAAFGVDPFEIPREISFCDHTIRQNSIMVVPDAAQDPRFCSNPLVTSPNGIRFYAGVPLTSPDGFPLGALCVHDTKPGDLNPEQCRALETLARQVNARVELRMQRRALERALAEAEEARAKLQVADQRFNTFMNNGPFVAFLKDSESRYLSYNQAFATLFNISLTAWLGRSDLELFPGEFSQMYRTNDLRVTEKQETVVALEHTLNADGSTAIWRSYKFPCPADDGSTWVGGFALNVTEELRREAELQKSKTDLEDANRLLQELATTDPLTGLFNRRLFDDRLQFEFSRSRRKKLDLAVLMIDVDNFKQRNDTYGHDHGDRVLCQLADLIRSTVRETDIAARYGGEEFVALLPEANEPQAVGMSERILAAVHNAKWPFEPLTISIGAAALEDATPNPQRLITLADEALYAAKRAGKNRAVGYHAYYQRVVADLKLDNAARAAL